MADQGRNGTDNAEVTSGLLSPVTPHNQRKGLQEESDSDETSPSATNTSNPSAAASGAAMDDAPNTTQPKHSVYPTSVGISKLKSADQWPYWKRLVGIILLQAGYRDYASTTQPANWNARDDEVALSIIYMALSHDLGTQCAIHTTCAEIWEYLSDKFEPKGVFKRYCVYEHFMKLKWEDYKSLDEAISALERAITDCKRYDWDIIDPVKVVRLFMIAEDDLPMWISLKRDYFHRAEEDDENITFQVLAAEARLVSHNYTW